MNEALDAGHDPWDVYRWSAGDLIRYAVFKLSQR